MKAYRKFLPIQDPKNVVLSDVPFDAGQRVEVLLLPKAEELNTHIDELKRLFKTTQSLPQATAISEDEIAMEVEAYRNGL